MKTKSFSLQTKLSFGLYKNRTIEEVIDEDSSYITWCLANDEFQLDKEAIEYYDNNQLIV